jgi:hypothetical protein
LNGGGRLSVSAYSERIRDPVGVGIQPRSRTLTLFLL